VSTGVRETVSTGVRELHHWIDGNELLEPSERIVATSPIDRTAVSSVPLGSAVTVDKAVAGAKVAFANWREWAPVERGRMLTELSRRLRAEGEKFVEVEVSETGKLTGEMQASLTTAADYFEYYGSVVRAMFGETIGLGSGDHAFTSREPFGVVGMITPWNGPLTQASRGIAAALAAGNTVVIKPSVYTSSTTVMLAQLATEVGIPDGVLNVVLGNGRGVGSRIISHPDVRLIAFTGSVATGRIVAHGAAERLVPAILELGGKSPNIVFEDADLDAAAASALSICNSSGQQCAALSRLLVHASVYDQVVERVVQAMSERTPGDRLGPLTTEDQYATVMGYFDIAKEDGATLLTGGRPGSGQQAKGRYVHATVYGDVTRDMRIFQEEIFGPVLAVSRFEDEAEAIDLANDSDFGLVAGVWTNDSSRALRVASQIDAGQVMVNGGRTGIETPFGGYKLSGIGREKGFESLLNYTQVKTTVVSRR
jgi:aldehyde dehydrogenase (NAD+)